MTPHWKQQALIEAPVEDVWGLVSDPARFPEWAKGSVEVTGVPTRIEKGSTFRHTGKTPLGGKTTTIFEVAELDDLREIKLQCQRTGFYSHWLLTEARGSTFADVEFGLEEAATQYRAAYGVRGKRFFRRLAEESIDSLRKLMRRGDAAEHY